MFDDTVSLKSERFLRALHVSTLLTRANIRKLNGIAPVALLTSIMTLVFSGKNYFRLYSSGRDGFLVYLPQHDL